jgi:glycerophosphoryl diester phosphodiesterase
MPPTFDLQGHRGARGLRPENTLPSFEAALDAGVTSVETDIHLTRDGVPVLWHDPVLNDPPCTLASPGAADPSRRPALAALTLAELRCYRAAGNPDPARFPAQDPGPTPLAQHFADECGLDPHVLLTLADLFAFVAAYAGEPGRQAGKSDDLRRRAARLRFDLELKRVPFYPEAIGDGFDGRSAGLLERRLLEEVRAAGVVGRTLVRSFDHRCVALLRALEPGLTGAVLVAHTAPVDPAEVARRAGATVYCPSYQFLDADVVRRAQQGGVQVVPWTVNDTGAWERLLDWGVDGITTDYPDRLAAFLRGRGGAF